MIEIPYYILPWFIASSAGQGWVMTDTQFYEVISYVVPIATGVGWLMHWTWETFFRSKVQRKVQEYFGRSDHQVGRQGR